MSFLLRRAPMAIQPRAKPPKPPESQLVPCPFPDQWGPGLQQTRVCTFNYGLPFQWECTPWQTVGGQCNPVPPKPPEQQTLPCPAGQIGTGIQQSRVCVFDYTAGVWNCTAWQTVSSDCQPAAVVFNTPSQHFVPPLSGTGYFAGQEQTYGPVSVVSQGVTMTLTYHVYVQGDESNPPMVRLSDLTVTFNPPQVGTIQVYWDRDYASFSDKPADPSGTTQWLQVPNSEWTANATAFQITLLLA